MEGACGELHDVVGFRPNNGENGSLAGNVDAIRKGRLGGEHISEWRNDVNAECDVADTDDGPLEDDSRKVEDDVADTGNVPLEDEPIKVEGVVVDADNGLEDNLLEVEGDVADTGNVPLEDESRR